MREQVTCTLTPHAKMGNPRAALNRPHARCRYNNRASSTSVALNTPYSGPRSLGRYSYTEYEWTSRCLVDGFNRKYGRDVALPVLFEATTQIADVMLRQGWPDDAGMLRDALQASDEGRRAEQVGQQLLCARYRLLHKAGDAPLALTASLARYWPTSPS